MLNVISSWPGCAVGDVLERNELTEGFIAELKDFISDPGLVRKPVKLDELGGCAARVSNA